MTTLEAAVEFERKAPPRANYKGRKRGTGRLHRAAATAKAEPGVWFRAKASNPQTASATASRLKREHDLKTLSRQEDDGVWVYFCYEAETSDA